MKKIKIVGSFFAVLFGIFVFVYGGYDDSPGAQFLGLIFVILGILTIIRQNSK